MSYTTFFIEQFNEHHKAPKLNQVQLHRIFNIIDVEGQINATSPTNYELRKRFVGKLKALTGNKKPFVLLQEMIKLSE